MLCLNLMRKGARDGGRQAVLKLAARRMLVRRAGLAGRAQQGRKRLQAVVGAGVADGVVDNAAHIQPCEDSLFSAFCCSLVRGY